MCTGFEAFSVLIANLLRVNRLFFGVNKCSSHKKLFYVKSRISKNSCDRRTSFFFIWTSVASKLCWRLRGSSN